MTWTVHCGDCLDVLRTLPSASFDGMVTDPPSGIGFMGAEWDSDRGGRDAWIAWLREIMWEALRVLKPGARALVWALPRTSHWTGMALELAGFQVIDRVTHIFATGFPKSLNMERAVSCATCPLPGRHFPGRLPKAPKRRQGDHMCPVTPEGKRWVGHGTALKPAAEDWWLVMKPVAGTFAKNALEHGVGSIDIDATRIDGVGAGTTCRFFPGPCEGHDSSGRLGKTYHHAPREGEASAERRYADAGASDFAMTPGPRGGAANGRWAANVVFSHLDDCVLLGHRKVKAAPAWNDNRGPSSFTGESTSIVHHADVDGTETVEEWRCAEGCAVAELDAQSGVRKTHGGLVTEEMAAMGYRGGAGSAREVVPSIGGASRFFFVPKPSRAEREIGCEHLPLRTAGEMTDREEDSDGLESPRAGAGRSNGARNWHPTVKSIGLAKRLATLIRPPARQVGEPRRLLVLFGGSGTEGIGGLRAGWEEVVLIEREEPFAEIARARLMRWEHVPAHMDEADVAGVAEEKQEQQPSLFGTGR